jgi:hypothetical protein
MLYLMKLRITNKKRLVICINVTYKKISTCMCRFMKHKIEDACIKIVTENISRGVKKYDPIL